MYCVLEEILKKNLFFFMYKIIARIIEMLGIICNTAKYRDNSYKCGQMALFNNGEYSHN